MYGQYLINVSVYIGDASTRYLPLVGVDNIVHDWYWILGMWEKVLMIQKLPPMFGGLGLLL